jgi:hypothetical protein
MDASQPAGQRPRPRVRRLYGALRRNAIPLRGTDLARIWFDFPDQPIKVPYTRELGLLAGDVDSNGNAVDNDTCTNACEEGICQPTGARAQLNMLTMDTASGCWSGNPCKNDLWDFQMVNGQSFWAFGEKIVCSGAATCVSHVGVGTYSSTTTCQGRWDVLCDNVMVGTIDTNGKACTGSAMSNGCSVTFMPRKCANVELRAVNDGNNIGGCCGGGTQPDSMIVAVSAW